MSCLCVVCLPCCVLLLVSSCFVAIVRIRSSTLGSASSVRLLHGVILLPCGISGKMTATLDLTTIIAMLVASFYRYAALPITCLSSHPILPWTSNLWHLSYANRCLAMLPLCSAPLIALLVAGEDWSLFLVGTWRCCSLLEHVYLLGYHNISYLINASIYLVKGGRLGLMPGVLFHSCRPSFRHTGVMFPDFAFLTRLGYNGNPLTVRLK